MDRTADVHRGKRPPIERVGKSLVKKSLGSDGGGICNREEDEQLQDWYKIHTYFLRLLNSRRHGG
jgi:hypothetical protein